MSKLAALTCMLLAGANARRNTMEQLWFTPEAEDWTDEQRELLVKFREALYECNPLCQSYVRACELRDDPSIEHHDVTLEFKYGDDGGPEVSAFVQTADADKLPPQLQCVAWEAGGAQPRSKPVHGGIADALTSTTLFPEAFGVMQPGQTRAIRFEEPEGPEEELHNTLADRRLTVPQHTRFLIYQMPDTFRCARCPAVCPAAAFGCICMLFTRSCVRRCVPGVHKRAAAACRLSLARSRAGTTRACCKSSYCTSGPTQSTRSCRTSTRQLQRSSTAAPTKTRTCRAPCTRTPLRRHRATTQT